MSITLQTAASRGGWRFPPRLAWILAGALLFVVLLVIAIPQLNFWFGIYWGYRGIKEVLYQDLHLGDALSTFLAQALAFFYAFAWTPLLYLAYRRDARRIGVAFVCYLFLFGLTPLLKASFGGGICFNQTTDKPEKWYVKNRDGSITLYDSPGYDSVGVAKQPVTTAICQAYDSQRQGSAAHPITADVRSIEFFRTDNGGPKVWYDIGPDGKVHLFDGPGFDPQTGSILQPATGEIRERALREQQTSRDESNAAQQRAALEAAAREKEAEAQAQAERDRAAAAAAAEQHRQEAAARREAQIRAQQQNREAALNCHSDARCSLVLAENGATVPIDVPLGKTACFDSSFWRNLGQLGYQTSAHGSAFEDFGCTREQVFGGTCALRYMDRFRFQPQAGVPLPRYWFVDAGARRC